MRAACAQGVAIEVVAETASTNADLLARLPTLEAPLLLIAERQTAGRGRAGRTWHSVAGAGLTFSLAWKFDLPLQDMLGLPLAVGVAIAEALADLNVHVQLKWPNDVLKDGKKLGGILIETAAAQAVPYGFQQYPGADQANWAVIGIGLNLAVPDALEAQIGHKVADAPWLARLDRNTLMAALLNGLSEMLLTFQDKGFRHFTARWNRLHSWTGQNLVVVDHGQIVQQGRALGVDSMGRLLLDTLAGRVAVLAGDVSLHKQEG